MLSNFGVVLGGLCAPIPILSDSALGYVAVFAVIGMMIAGENIGIYEIKKRWFC